MQLKMIAILVTLAICLVNTEAQSIIRIANGTAAEEGEFKFAVSVRVGLGHLCGGSIINEKHVLTAAHCVCNDDQPQDASMFNVQYGSINISQTDERSIQVSKISCGNFNLETLTNDVAVLKLETALPDDGLWEPVLLARHFNTSTTAREGTIIGWGSFTDDGPISYTLQKLDVTMYNDFVCGESEMFVPEHHICFGTLIGSACYGDSGSALLSNLKGDQVGICSFKTGPCGHSYPTRPNVYSRVTTYIDWIEEQSKLPMHPDPFTVRYGSVYISSDIQTGIYRLEFSTYLLINDAVILELETPLPDDGTWEAVKLTSEFDTSMDTQPGTIIGWGYLYDGGPLAERLQKLDVDIYYDDFCTIGVLFEPENHICIGVSAGGACGGDSGGALLSATGEQVGISSFLTTTCGVATPDRPNIYTRITRYLEWIKDVAGL